MRLSVSNSGPAVLCGAGLCEKAAAVLAQKRFFFFLFFSADFAGHGGGCCVWGSVQGTIESPQRAANRT
jgi:hypothetical protein